MKRWHVPTLDASSDKLTAREPGTDAPRVPSTGAQKPRVLFSSPECRLIALDLGAGEELPEHHVRERAVVQVVSGRFEIDASGETVECETGTLITFSPRRTPSAPRPRQRETTLTLAHRPPAAHKLRTEAPEDRHLPATPPRSRTTRHLPTS